MLQFNKTYFTLTFLLVLTEIVIALYAHDRIIRPYAGDFLVVIMLYCLVKSVINSDLKNTAIAVLLFAYLIEIMQYFHILKVLGFENSRLARVVLGTSFEWTDMLAYTLGIIFVFIIETKNKAQSAV